VERDPDNPRLLAQRAWLRLSRGPLAPPPSADDLDAALRDANDALALSPGHVPYLQLRSEVHLQRGEGAQAVADCQALLERPSRANPLEVLLNQLAYTRARAGVDLEQGLQEVEQALSEHDDPQNALQQLRYLNALDTRGYLHYLLGNDVEAMRDLSRAVEQFDEVFWRPWDFELEAKRSFDLRQVQRRDAIYRETLAVMLYHRSLVNERLDPAAAQRDRERIAVLLPGYDGRELH
jgi:tetratricopeptide (TPR) repeat protein